MRREKYIYNQLLLRYNKYCRKQQRLQLNGRNVHRQGVLARHIQRIKTKLENLYTSIKLTTAGALITGAMLMSTSEATAQQTFNNYQVNPFGLTSAYSEVRPALVDLDGDNVLDLVIGEEYGRFFYYHNSGTTENPSFDAPQLIASDIGKYSSPSFADIDSDGDMDMIASSYYYDYSSYYYVSRFQYFRNTLDETSTVGFDTPTNDPLGLPVIQYSYIISSQMGDVDGDGDLDMVYVNNDYGIYFVNRNGATGQFDPPTKLGIYTSNPVSLLDLDEDGDLDLFYKDFSNLVYYENTAGVANTPSFSQGDRTPFRINDGGFSYQHLFFASGDLDNDGDKDLLTGARDGELLFFENSLFSFQEGVVNPFNLASPGVNNQPVLVDIDGDTDLDLFSGTDTNYGNNFRYFENQGTNTNPSFGSIQQNPFGLTNIGTQDISVGFTDLDNDGDEDMLATEFNGNTFYLKNRLIEDGSVSFEAAVANPFGLGTLGAFSRFSFVDLDNDQDSDIIVGKQDGTFTFVENTGTISAPAFAAEVTMLKDIGSNSSPTAIDFDGDGDFDIFAGSADGIYFFENIGSKTSSSFANPIFEPFGLFDFNQTPITPNFGDLDGDGDQDLLSGSQSGFLFFQFESVVAFTSATTASSVENNTAPVLDVNANIAGGTNDAGITYSVSGVDKAQFSIDAMGMLSFNPPPDFEAPADAGANNVYDVVVIAGSSGGATSQVIQVTVTDIAESTFAFNSQPTATVNENVSDAMIVRASQTDTGGSVTYAIAGGDDQGDFTIDPNTGVLSFVGNPDAENPADANTDNIYLVDVEATDASGTIAQSLTITVQDVNDNAVAITAPGTSVSVNENIDLATIIVVDDPDIISTQTYALTGNDESRFNIDASGQLTFIQTPDYENPHDFGQNNIFDVTVTVSDGLNTDALTLTVTILNIVNEQPKFTSVNGVSLAENNTAVIDVDANDGDGGSADVGITYSVGGTDGLLFTIDTNSGQLDFITAPDREAPLDNGGDNIYEVEVTADDGVNQTVQPIMITVTDENDSAPQITSSNTITLNENETTVSTIAVADWDLNSNFTYSISGGSDAAQFLINASSGLLTFNPPADFEVPADQNMDNVYVVEVNVSDGVQSTAQSMSISIDNVVEMNLAFPTTTLTSPENQLAGPAARASVPDGRSAATYTITGGDDASHFSIDPAIATLSFVSNPNFENPADADINNEYLVEVTADDGVEIVAQTFSIQVNDANDAPVITLPDPILHNEQSGLPISFTATDEDGDAVSFTITGGDHGDVSASDGVNKPWRPADYANQTSMYAQIPRFYSAVGDNIDQVELTAFDGTTSSVRLLNIAIQDVNTNTPTITSTAINHPENGQTVAVVATDGDPTDVLTLSIVGGTDQALFGINGVSGAVEFLIAPDFENPGDVGGDNVYDVTIEVTDGTFSSQSAVAINVTDVDEIAPVITLTGTNPQEIEAGSTYSELGATVSDNFDGDISGSVVIDASAVNTSVLGSYSVTYDVTDANGNVAVQVIRMVDVVDTTVPVITLTGANPQEIEAGSTYSELGASASDNLDGDISGSITIEASLVNTSMLGSYSVTYDVTDANGNVAVQVIRMVDVVDTTIPVITLTGADPQTIEVGSTYVELGASASDNLDGDISGSITIDASAVNTSVLGSYSVAYDVTDANSNAAAQVTRTVNVVDTTIPVITLTGADPQTIEVGSTYVELGASASDNLDGDISGSITIDASAVNTSVLGSYSVTYDVTDANSNAAAQVTRTVNVVDTTIPVITLTGADPQTIEVGGTYVELGATASDNYDGNLSGSVIIDASAVNASVLGSYSVTYDVTDANGNSANQMVRAVNVVDTTVPVINLIGSNPQSIEFGSSYIEQGATALDNYDGDISGSVVIDASAVNASVLGSYSVTYDVIDANGNSAVQLTRTVNIVKASQTITFTDDLSNVDLGNGFVTLTATGGASGETVTYSSSDPSVASVSGNTLTLLSAGTTTITASQAGNANYNAATPVDQLLTVTAVFVWNGTSWNTGSTPTSADDVRIDGDYTFSTNGVFDANNLEVSIGAKLTVNDNPGNGSALIVNGALINTGTVHVVSGASLVTLGSVTGTGYQIDRTTTFDTNTGRYSIVGSPVQNSDFNTLGTNALIYGYDEAQAYNPTGDQGLDRFKSPAALSQTTMNVGAGYFSAFTGDANGLVSFTGTPNTGTINVPLSYTNHGIGAETVFQGFNLVSNPYPSAIDFATLISENSGSDITGSIYLWDDNNSNTTRGSNADYVIVNSLGNTDSQNNGITKWDGYIRSGQGFFVQANSPTSLTFNNNMRILSNNDDGGFYRTAREATSIKLLISNEQSQKATVIGFAQDATIQTDKHYDAASLSTANLQLYSMQPKDINKLGIQGLPTGYREEIKLGFKAEAGAYKISIANIKELEGMEVILLKDHLTNRTINLKDEDYSFTTEGGENTERFTLQISPSVVSSLDQLQEEVFYTYSTEGQLNVVFQTAGFEQADFKLIDLKGKTVYQESSEVRSNKWQMGTNHFPKNIYILMIRTDYGVWKRRVVTK